jgi:hypothetical protein
MKAKNLVGAAFIATALSLSFCMAYAAADPSTAAQNENRAALEKWTTEFQCGQNRVGML